MTPYRPDKFTRLYRQNDGERLWMWLNRPQQKAVMRTAAHLRRPAIEALSPLLADAFPDVISRAMLRRMVGHMVRQVMDNCGFYLHRSNVKVKAPHCQFGWGAVYSQRVAA